MAVPSGTLVVELVRTLPAARPIVFDAFTDASELTRWWGPEGFSVPWLEFNPRVGASYRIEMQPPQGGSFHLTGKFQTVDPPSRLAFTFAWEPPDPDDVETLADLSFRDLGGFTEVAFRQGPFRTDERRALHQGGWSDAFDKLERLLRSAVGHQPDERT